MPGAEESILHHFLRVSVTAAQQQQRRKARKKVQGNDLMWVTPHNTSKIIKKCEQETLPQESTKRIPSGLHFRSHVVKVFSEPVYIGFFFGRNENARSVQFRHPAFL